MPVLTNLLSHSDFDNAGWTAGVSCTISYDSSIKKYGDYSLKVTSTASSSTENLFYLDDYPAQVQGHIYYGRCEMYQTVAGASTGMQIYWPEAEPSMGVSSYDSSNINTWQIQSFRIVRDSWSSGNQRFRFDVENMSSPNYVYIDGALLIDLTESYGSGNEPDQAWCDVNIPWFSGTLIIGKLQAGDILNFNYSGAAQTIALPAGKYKLECWGAQGGNYSSYKGGYGGYSSGVLSLVKSGNIYVYVGGQGSSSAITGGFNGGGSGIKNGRGGGGASDIRIGQDSLYSRAIVAGGGGGSGVSSSGSGKGVGGGTSGLGGYTNETTINGSNRSGGGGTQTEGGISWKNVASTKGSFGQGGNASSYSCGGGGGGWYGGGGAYDNDSDADGRNGGGGSGYIYTESTASNYPSGCLLNSNYYLTEAQTVSGSTSFLSPSGGSETGHTGNGFARITVIEIASTFSVPVHVNDTWEIATDGFVKVDGSWESIEQVYVKANNVWEELSHDVTVLIAKTGET